MKRKRSVLETNEKTKKIQYFIITKEGATPRPVDTNISLWLNSGIYPDSLLPLRLQDTGVHSSCGIKSEGNYTCIF